MEHVGRSAYRSGSLQKVGIVLGTAVLALSTIVPIAAARPPGAAPAFGTKGIPDQGARGISVRADVAARDAAAFARQHPRAADHLISKVPRLQVPVAHPKPASEIRTANSGRATAAASNPTPLLTLPDVAVVKQWDGLGQAESGGWVPADPWVAANSTHVIQTVNSSLRISNRTGAELLTVPTWAFFAVPPHQIPTDPRMLWDATHGRWVGVTMSYADDFTYSLTYLNIAVSEGADPTGGWRIYAIEYLNALPDYPSIASSNDKIVIADNLFDNSLAFLAADINTITWASILGGGELAYDFCDGNSFAHPRAAQVLSASNDVHVVMEALLDGSQFYVRVTSTGSCPALIDVTSMTSSLGLDPFTLPPDPRQVGPDTIANAVDERPTDAVWRAGQLWWVSTFPYTYDGAVTWNDQVIYWGTTTTINGAPVGSSIIQVTPGDGVDAFMGGIGMSRSGIPFVTYSQSSASDPVALFANRISGGLLGTPVLLDTGDAALSSERWGDFAGVAMDPVGTGTVWVSHMLAAADGTWRTTVARLLVDADAPSNPGAPTVTTLSPAALTGSPNYKIAWGAATDGASGSVFYRLETSIDGGSFGGLTYVAGTSTTRPLPLGHTYRFRVGAIDAIGIQGGLTTGPTVHPLLYQQSSSTTYVGTWSTANAGSFSGGSVRYASVAGRTATFSTTGVRSFAFVTTKGSTRGSFKVYVDGVYKTTISAYSTTFVTRQILYQITFASPGTHSIKIYVMGTAGHPRVDFDGVLVLK